MATMSSYLSIITMNINGSSSPIKDRVAKWTGKDPPICCPQDITIRLKKTHGLKMKEWKKKFHANDNQKRARVAIFILVKIEF